MRLRNIPDQTVAQRIQDAQKDVLIALFERNLVSCLNLGIKYQLPEKQVHQFLAIAVVSLWYFFSKKSWRSSRHKIDFMVEYLFVRQVQRSQPRVKLRYDFGELDPYLQRVMEQTEPLDPLLVNNLTSLSHINLQSLALSLGDGRALWNVGQLLGKSESQAETLIGKAALKWFGLVRQNLHLQIDTEGLKKDMDRLMAYRLGVLGPTEMASMEVALSTDSEMAPKYAAIKTLDSTTGNYRTSSLLGMILGKSAKRLTGNIWGNGWSMASAVFIALMGLLIWYAKRREGREQTPNTNPIEIHDTTIR